MDEPALRAHLEQTAAQAKLEAVAVVARQEDTGKSFVHHGDRWFHAASTFKAAVLFALLRAVHEDRARLQDQLHVRNRFLSLVEAPPYRIDGERDGESTVYREIGRSLPLHRLAEKMIVRSSNLATNLLLDFLTVAYVQSTLTAAGVHGLAVRRGVEDLAAHEAGINNEATALGLVQLFEAFRRPDSLPDELRETGMQILFGQEFKSMLPGRLPKGTRVAHKTGEISTHTHDAGIVFPAAGAPYEVAILTEHAAGSEGRQRAVAEMSRAVFDFFHA